MHISTLLQFVHIAAAKANKYFLNLHFLPALSRHLIFLEEGEYLLSRRSSGSCGTYLENLNLGKRMEFLM